MATRIIVDSACDLTMEEAADLGVTMLPMRCLFGTEEFLDGVNLSHQEFFEKLESSPCHPTTSQVPPAEFQQEFDAVHDAGDDCVCITISSQISGTNQSAHLALACGRAVENEDVHIVDSNTLCITEQLLVRLAARMRDAGANAKRIAHELGWYVPKTRLLALFDTLEYAARGGRVPRSVAAASGLLSIKPLITADNGKISVPGIAKGWKAGCRKLAAMKTEGSPMDPNMPFVVAYSGNSDERLRAFIEGNPDLLPGSYDSMTISTIGACIGTHAGPGAIAMAYFAL